jgi:hypothetical protein
VKWFEDLVGEGFFLPLVCEIAAGASVRDGGASVRTFTSAESAARELILAGICENAEGPCLRCGSGRNKGGNRRERLRDKGAK